eukprot:2332044-Rhodomonas_salina.1
MHTRATILETTVSPFDSCIHNWAAGTQGVRTAPRFVHVPGVHVLDKGAYALVAKQPATTPASPRRSEGMRPAAVLTVGGVVSVTASTETSVKLAAASASVRVAAAPLAPSASCAEAAAVCTPHASSGRSKGMHTDVIHPASTTNPAVFEQRSLISAIRSEAVDADPGSASRKHAAAQVPLKSVDTEGKTAGVEV